MMPFFFLYFYATRCNGQGITLVYINKGQSNRTSDRGLPPGDRSSQLKLYKQYAQRLYIACLRIVGNSSRRKKPCRTRSSRSSHAWTNIMTGNALRHGCIVSPSIRPSIMYVAKHRTKRSFPTIWPNRKRTDEEEIQYSVAQIKEATTKLPAGYRIILSLYLFEGYDMEEIASILKIQPPSVRSQYLRAKRKLLDIIAAN